MAAVLTQRRLRRFLEGVQHIQRHKGLGGTTEATAVDTDLLRRPFGIYLLLAAGSLLLRTKKTGKGIRQFVNPLDKTYLCR